MSFCVIIQQMYITDKFIFACSLHFYIVLLMRSISIMIYFLFFDEYISNLLTFFEQYNVRSAHWYYDHHFIFKFFLFFFSSWLNDIVVFRLFKSVLLMIRLCITESSIVNDFFLLFESMFYTIINNKNDLTDLLYKSQFF